MGIKLFHLCNRDAGWSHEMNATWDYDPSHAFCKYCRNELIPVVASTGLCRTCGHKNERWTEFCSQCGERHYDFAKNGSDKFWRASDEDIALWESQRRKRGLLQRLIGLVTRSKDIEFSKEVVEPLQPARILEL